MRILVTGCSGQLGRAMLAVARGKGWDAQGFNHAQLDICEAQAVERCIEELSPDAVVNAAAYTRVDEAERERDRAFAVNCDGAANLAQACAARDIPLVHVSTDYVFDGRKKGAYTEEDAPSPLGVYGASKLAGEETVRRLCPRHWIMRTSWLFSATGRNFVATILRLARERDEIRIVNDQYGCPTAAAELARAISHVLSRDETAYGTYHFCQPEPVSWHGFAVAIVAEAKAQGMVVKVRNIQPITTGEYPTLARRPANSVMDCAKFTSAFDYIIPRWRESLPEVIGGLLHAGI